LSSAELQLAVALAAEVGPSARPTAPAGRTSAISGAVTFAVVGSCRSNRRAGLAEREVERLDLGATNASVSRASVGTPDRFEIPGHRGLCYPRGAAEASRRTRYFIAGSRGWDRVDTSCDEQARPAGSGSWRHTASWHLPPVPPKTPSRSTGRCRARATRRRRRSPSPKPTCRAVRWRRHRGCRSVAGSTRRRCYLRSKREPPRRHRLRRQQRGERIPPRARWCRSRWSPAAACWPAGARRKRRPPAHGRD